MRALLIAAPILTLGCSGPSGKPVADRAGDAPPVSISITLDRAILSATDEVTGTIHFECGAPPRESGEDATAWCASFAWHLELANESATLLDVVVDGVEEERDPIERWIVSSERVADYRFRVVPCPAFAERSRATAIPLRSFEPGNHAMRIVCAVSNLGGWAIASMGAPRGMRLVPLEGCFTSRWSTFDIVPAGRPLDADDLEAIVSSMEDRRAADVLSVLGPRVLAPERLVAIVAHASGLRRGYLAEAVARQVSVGTWLNHEAWQAYRSLFAEVGETGLECSSHEAPPLFHRIGLGRIVPIRNGAAESHNFSMLRVGGDVTANFYLPPNRSVDTRNAVGVPGLFRVKCDMHPAIWGWLLVE